MSGNLECKNKGTKSSFEINQVLNCDSMMQKIQKELANPLQCRRFMNNDIFGVNWDKRVVEKGTGATCPYGYICMAN